MSSVESIMVGIFHCHFVPIEAREVLRILT